MYTYYISSALPVSVIVCGITQVLTVCVNEYTYSAANRLSYNCWLYYVCCLPDFIDLSVSQATTFALTRGNDVGVLLGDNPFSLAVAVQLENVLEQMLAWVWPVLC